jgi:hypothetical protein
MALYAGYGEGMALHGADALVVNISRTLGVVTLEYAHHNSRFRRDTPSEMNERSSCRLLMGVHGAFEGAMPRRTDLRPGAIGFL